MNHELGSLLGRWHQWRRAWSPERKHARVALLSSHDPDDDLEALTMRLVEQAVDELAPEHQIAIQHVARAECMGVEVFSNARLGDPVTRDIIVARALRALERVLLRHGVL